MYLVNSLHGMHGVHGVFVSLEDLFDFAKFYSIQWNLVLYAVFIYIFCMNFINISLSDVEDRLTFK